jgi:molybdate transport system substrate-binding protein
MTNVRALAAAFAALLSLFAGTALAGQTNVAVADDFTGPAKEIAALFEQKTGHHAVLTFGASGSLFAQIIYEAPFQVFLSADQSRPKSVIEGGYGVTGTRFTYAIGKLVLWSRVVDVTKGDEVLKAEAFSSLAIANPNVAPYGIAAAETMRALGVFETLKPKIVLGKSAAKAYQLVDAKKADVGFVPLSHTLGASAGTRWLVPQGLYSPIRQDAVLLRKGENDEASKVFLEFLKGPEARAIIEKFGYTLE